MELYSLIMKMTSFSLTFFALVSLLFLSSCNVSNPRITKRLSIDNVKPIGPITLSDLYAELDNFADDSSLIEGTKAEGEVSFYRTKSFQFQSGAVTCLMVYSRARYQIITGPELSLGHEMITELTPIEVENQTSGTQSVKEMCENDFNNKLPLTGKSTLVASVERKLVANSLQEFLSEIERACQQRELLAGLRCQELQYEIKRNTYFSSGNPLQAYQIKLHLTLNQSDYGWTLLFSPLGAGIMNGGILELNSEIALPGLHAGSLGEIKQLELSNLQ